MLARGDDRDTTEPVVAGHVEVTTEPTALTVSPDGSRVYVLSAGARVGAGPVLAVIDAATLAVIASVATCVGPIDVAAQGTLLLVACGGGNALRVMDAATLTVTRTIDLGAEPRAIAVAPGGAEAYVLAYGSKAPRTKPALIIVDIEKGRVLTRVRVGTISQALVLSPSGRRAYVSNWGARSVTVVNTRSRTVAATIDVSPTMPGAMAVNPEGSRLLVNRENAGVPKPRILTINTERLEQTAAFRPGVEIDAMAYSDSAMTIGDGFHRAGTLLLVSGEYENEQSLIVIDLRDQRVLTSVALEQPCRGADDYVDFAVAPDARRAYVLGECLGQPGTVTAVDLPE